MHLLPQPPLSLAWSGEQPIWSLFKMVPRPKAKQQTSTEFISPTRTTFLLEISGHQVRFTRSSDTMLLTPIKALSAVLMIAARQEQVITVTKKYLLGARRTGRDGGI